MAILINKMRYLGIDYGLKRVGVAVSDTTKTFATPLVVLDNTEELFRDIKKICEEQDIDTIIIGESKNFKFEDNDIMDQIKEFVVTLGEVVNLPIYMHPEFLTSMEAERIQGKNDMHDASAAAIILQSYINSEKSKLENNQDNNQNNNGQ